MEPSVFAIATMDTKGNELAYVADRLRAAGIDVLTVDVGTMETPTVAPDIDRAGVAVCHPSTEGRLAALSRADRGQAVAAMGEALEVFLRREYESGRVSGVIGMGGSGGTALITSAMRALPVGQPKLMVSTVASGNVAPYVGSSDITLMYSVVDIAGLNAVSRRVLG
ncbi:MAG: Tm-1-like ATP-binding domain-containing protein, partial [Isosphaeraceae bacterium]